MNRYIWIRRLRGPVFLLLVGIIALLNEADILTWHHAWPLFLIVLGVLMLAERAALAGAPLPTYPGNSYGAPPYGTNPYGQPYAPPQPGAPAATGPAQTSTSIVPHTDDYGTGGGER